MSDRSWRLSEMHHVGLTVSDIEKSIEFYRDLLGMELVRRREADADYIGMQTGYPGVKLSVASFKPTPDSEQSMEVVRIRHVIPALFKGRYVDVGIAAVGCRGG